MKLPIYQLLVSMFILLLASCASNNPQKMYSGPEKPQSDLALLIWNNQAVKPGYNGVQIDQIDGEATSLFNGAKAWVLPGKHKVVQKCFRPYQKHSVTVDGKVYGKDPSEIVVEAGKRYFYQGKAKVVTKYKEGVLGKYWQCDLHHWEI